MYLSYFERIGNCVVAIDFLAASTRESLGRRIALSCGSYLVCWLPS